MSRRKERATRSATGEAGPRCLIVDDEEDILELLELTLLRMGIEVDRASRVAEAKGLIDANAYDLCLTDMRMPDGDGLEVVKHIAANGGDTPVAVITAHGSAENAVAALKAGAFDYLAKPVSLDQLRTLVKSALKLPQAVPAGSTSQGLELLGESKALQAVRDLIERISRSQAPVYITGESGSGKERAARLIHERGARNDRPFVAVNCGAIPENLMESLFFGHRKGAFTGADQDRDGFFQAAEGGTLFLDEVADLPLPMQVKLLRVIQEKHVCKVGDTVEAPADVRVICATHQNLSECVSAGRFRQDLYYRLAVIELRMPPLRDLKDDIPAIAESILLRLATAAGRRPPTLDKAALQALSRYDFPGNVRELENVLERALALAEEDRIGVDDLQLAPMAEARPADAGGGDAHWPLQEYLDRMERDAIQQALEKTRYNRTAAARLLGVTFRSLRYRMERLGID